MGVVLLGAAWILIGLAIAIVCAKFDIGDNEAIDLGLLVLTWPVLACIGLLLLVFVGIPAGIAWAIGRAVNWMVDR